MEYLSRENLFAWLDGLKTEYEVFVPVKKGTNRFYQRYLEPSEDIVIGEVRTTDPLKGFFRQSSQRRPDNLLILVPVRHGGFVLRFTVSVDAYAKSNHTTLGHYTVGDCPVHGPGMNDAVEKIVPLPPEASFAW